MISPENPYVLPSVVVGAAVGDTTDPDDVADAAVDAADGTADAADVADGDINDLDDAGVTDDSTDGRAT